MNYSFGSREEFFGFVDSIGPEDRVGILTHTDTDGIASAVFMKDLLESKGVSLERVWFLDLKIGMYDEFLEDVKGKKLTKLFLTDLSESVDAEGFQKVRKDFDLFLIDHHPISANLLSEDFIKTDSGFCAAQIVFDLMDEDLKKKWAWLADAAIIMDYVFKTPENFEYLQKKYPGILSDDVFASEPGKIGQKIANSIIYFNKEKNLEKVYNLLLEKDLKSLAEYSKNVEDVIVKFKKVYRENAEYFSERDLYFFYFETTPKFNVLSTAMSLVSNENKDATYICVAPLGGEEGFLKVSARNQNGTQRMNDLLEKGIVGCEGATAGGHPKASGGSFRKKDFEKFKKNLLS